MGIKKCSLQWNAQWRSIAMVTYEGVSPQILRMIDVGDVMITTDSVITLSSLFIGKRW